MIICEIGSAEIVKHTTDIPSGLVEQHRTVLNPFTCVWLLSPISVHYSTQFSQEIGKNYLKKIWRLNELKLLWVSKEVYLEKQP